MEYMPLLLRKFLGGSAPDLPANEFKAYMLALAHIYEDEAPVAERVMERHLTVKGWRTVRDRLIDKGCLFRVPGGFMDHVALEVLQDYHVQQAQASENGRRAGLISAAKRRGDAKKQAAVADLFANRTLSTRTAEKANEFNAADQQGVDKRAGAHARKRDANAMHSGSIGDASQMVSGSLAKLSNENNEGSQHPVNQREVEVEEEYTPPLSPLAKVELVEGEVEEFAVPRRKSGKPIPDDWSPEAAQLSDAVTNMIAEWPEGEFEREATKFTEDAHAKDRRHVNWDRAFGVWLTRHDGFMSERSKRYDRASGWNGA